MGVYSTDRINQSLAENADIAAIMESIDQVDTSKVRVDNLMESVLAIYENDHKLFGAVLECDFISTTNLMVMESADAEVLNEEANEQKKEGIWQNIKNTIAKAIEWIKQQVAKFAKMIKDFFDIDLNMVKKFDKTLTMENLKDFPGIKDFSFPKTLITEDSIKNADNAAKVGQDEIRRIRGAEDREEVDTYLTRIMDAIEKEKNDMRDDLNAGGKYFEDQKAKWMPTDKSLKMMKRAVEDGKGTVNAIKRASAISIARLKGLEAEAKAARKVDSKFKKAIGKDAAELEVYKLNKIYSAASAITKAHIQMFSDQKKLAVKQLQAFRKAYAICGNYALKKSKQGEKVNESTLLFDYIGESSDMYVAEFFGY